VTNNRNTGSPARQPRGRPSGGQFAATNRPEADIELGGPETPAAPGVPLAEYDSTDDPNLMWEAIDDRGSTREFLVAANRNLDKEQVAALLEPDRDQVVRWNCARTHPEIAGRTVMNDNDPFVKIWATHPRAGLTPDEVARVYADPGVDRIHRLMTGQDPEGTRRLERMAAGLGS
jgi:hypothetical protein